MLELPALCKYVKEVNKISEIKIYLANSVTLLKNGIVVKMRGLFITGTDTDVGKTSVTVALLKQLLLHGKNVRAVKPVQTGCLREENGLVAPDVSEYLLTGAQASVLKCFEPACSPDLAAQISGEVLSVDSLMRDFKAASFQNDVLLVEGAGGLYVPLNSTETMLDFMRALDFPVLLVVGNKLGCLNHAALSLEALLNRGIKVVGMVLNRVRPVESLDPGAGDDIENQKRFLKNNARALHEYGRRKGVPLLAEIDYSDGGRINENCLEDVVKTLFLDQKQKIDDYLQFDREHLWHPYTSATDPLPVQMVRSAHGRTLKLMDGKELIDGTSSWWCTMHGYSHPRLIEAVQHQVGQLSHVMFGGLTHEPAIRLGQKLLALVPKNLKHIFYADSGSVAVEVALKMAVQYWAALGLKGKKYFLTPRGGYHGDTQGAMQICDPIDGMHSLFKEVLHEQIFAPRPDSPFNEEFKPESLEPIEKILSERSNEIAALVIEPIVQGAGGMWFYHPLYLKGLRELCDRYNVLLVLDEIATGFGRTGQLFACNWAEIEPDVMCIGKGLTGGMMTLSATLTTEKVAGTISDKSSETGGAFMHGPTFMANPLACSVACASLDLFNEMHWQEKVLHIESCLKRYLSEVKNLSHVVDVRVLCAIGVVQLDCPVNTRRLTEYFVQKGVWVRPFASLIYLMPAYTVTDEELKALCDALVSSVKEQIFL